MPGITTILATSVIVLSLMLGACVHPQARAAHEGGARVAAATDDASLSAQADPDHFEERAREVLGAKTPPRTDLPEQTLDSDLLYKFLLAEIAGQRENYQVAAQA